MKILFLSGRATAEIGFPAYQGKHGTCDFMTKQCSKECKLVPNPFELQALTYFQTHNAREVHDELIEQFNYLSCINFGWFIGSGDCPVKLTDKIVDVMSLISDDQIPQNGFTRNRIYWHEANKLKNTRIALTVEDEKEARQLSRFGLVAIPDYKTIRVKIINDNEYYMCGGGTITCGQDTVTIEDKYQNEDCSLCCETGFGCYALSKN